MRLIHGSAISAGWARHQALKCSTKGICRPVPQTGDSLVTLSSQDHYSALGQEGNFLLAEDFSTASVNADIFASAFCPDCDEEQLTRVAASQIAEPLGPLNTPVTLTAENFGSVRRAYILTAEDIVVTLRISPPHRRCLTPSSLPHPNKMYAPSAL